MVRVVAWSLYHCCLGILFRIENGESDNAALETLHAMQALTVASLLFSHPGSDTTGVICSRLIPLHILQQPTSRT